jgi:hypothetical protein
MTAMKTVFVLQDHDDEIMGIYSSRERAEAQRRAFGPRGDYLELEELPLDHEHPLPKHGEQFFMVHKQRKDRSGGLIIGVVSGCHAMPSRINRVEKLGMDATILEHGRWVQVHADLITIVSAPSKDKAKELACKLFDDYENHQFSRP